MKTSVLRIGGRKAIRFVVHPELGAIVGTIASLAGKRPADTKVWVAQGQVPAFLKQQGPLYQGGPIWSIEMTTPVWEEAPKTGP